MNEVTINEQREKGAVAGAMVRTGRRWGFRRFVVAAAAAGTLFTVGGSVLAPTAAYAAAVCYYRGQC
jgi:hypothetical protein